jgi:hypothetical protein
VSTQIWDLFKRRVVPIAFICAMAVLVQKTCNKQQTRTHATIVLDLGDASLRVKTVDAQLKVGDDIINTFHRVALEGLSIGPCTFAVAMPAEDGTLTIDVELPAVKKHLTRRIHADEGATITIPLAADLRD